MTHAAGERIDTYHQSDNSCMVSIQSLGPGVPIQKVSTDLLRCHFEECRWRRINVTPTQLLISAFMSMVSGKRRLVPGQVQPCYNPPF